MQSDPDRIAVGVVGVGGMGTVHADNLHALNPGVQVVAVMDSLDLPTASVVRIRMFTSG